MRFELNDNRNECARHGRGPRATFYRMLFPLPPRTPSWPADFQHVELTERIIGVAMQVIRELGAGFVESVYRRAMMVALDDEGLRAEEHVPIGVSFRGREVGHFQGDILVEGKVLLELKAVRALAPDHQAQLINDLKAKRPQWSRHKFRAGLDELLRLEVVASPRRTRPREYTLIKEMAEQAQATQCG